LRIFGHVIHFIQNYKFNVGSKERLRGYKTVDLVANDVNAALIGCIQMNHEAAIRMLHRGLLVLIHKIYDGGGFTRARRAVKEQVWEMSGCNDIAQHEFIERVKHNVIKMGWTIFFHPGG